MPRALRLNGPPEAEGGQAVGCNHRQRGDRLIVGKLDRLALTAGLKAEDHGILQHA